MTPKVNSWSPSRLADYDQCPLAFKLKHLIKCCPLCFKGPVKGGYDTPALCTSCGEEIVKGNALVRGSAIGKTLEDYVSGKTAKLTSAWGHADGTSDTNKITHPKVVALAKAYRAGFKKAKVAVEKMLNFDRDWNLLPQGWSPKIWLIIKMDVFQHVTGKSGRVVDWKTGGVDKRTGEVRGDPKYAEQLQIYSVAALSAFPQMEAMTSALCFVDAGEKFDPVIEMASGYITRDGLKKQQKALEKRVLPLFNDKTFAPRGSDKCRFCSFSKTKGGPCPIL
jgi:hypothetical protein